MNPIRRLWRRLTRRTVKEANGEFGYPVNPYPPWAGRDFWLMAGALDDYQRRRTGAQQSTARQILATARALCRYNPYAQGMMSALVCYVLGDQGLQVEASGDNPALVEQAQEWLDGFRDREDWWSREREIYTRAHRDGEVFLRYLEGGEGVSLRLVEPEQVLTDGTTDFPDGIRTDVDDAETELEYHVLYAPDESTYLGADEVLHFKLNVDRVITRGESDFASIAPLIERSLNCLKKTISAEAYRQSIAYHTEHGPFTTADSVQQHLEQVATFRQWAPNLGGVDEYAEVQDDVAVVHLSAGQKLSATPGGEAVSGAIAAINTAVLSASVRYHMPQWLATGDASRNNAIDLKGSSPFGRFVAGEQAYWCQQVRAIFWRALEWAAAGGELPAEALESVDIVVKPQRVTEDREPDKETNRLKTMHEAGVISRREWQIREGLDPDQMDREIAAERSKQRSRQLGIPAPGEAPALGANGNGNGDGGFLAN